jgi:hypothetical protein
MFSIVETTSRTTKTGETSTMTHKSGKTDLSLLKYNSILCKAQLQFYQQINQQRVCSHNVFYSIRHLFSIF